MKEKERDRERGERDREREKIKKSWIETREIEKEIERKRRE